MFTSIKNTRQDSYIILDNDGKESDSLESLKKVNIFVGQNNAGKSRFMRTLLDTDLQFSTIESQKLSILMDVLFDDFSRILPSKTGLWGHFESITNNLIKGSEGIITATDGSNSLFGKWRNLNSSISNYEKDHSSVNGRQYMHWATMFKGLIEQAREKTGIHEKDFVLAQPISIYIPLLRGLKNPFLQDKPEIEEVLGVKITKIKSAGDIFQKRTISDYWGDDDLSKHRFEIFTGLNLYEEVKSKLLGSPRDRADIKAFEKFLSDKFFRESVSLTPNTDDDVLYVSIGNTEKAIYDLGDGIQSIIINTFPLFKYRNNDIVLCLEEPEIGIHPGMQRILLETFVEGVPGKKGEHQIFLTTHSNHFLDIGLDRTISENISIFQFRDKGLLIKDGNGDFIGTVKEIKNGDQNKNILNLLGVRNSSVFLSNCIIWVEGVSDRIYIKKWLELYMEKVGIKRQFDEDKHYSIIEYGGGNITHFNFGPIEEDFEEINIEGINKSNFVVADNDKIIDYYDESLDPVNFTEIKKKRLRLRNYRKQLTLEDGTVNFYAETPEIENLISYSQYKKYFESYKGINWQIKSTILSEDKFNVRVLSEDIGDLLKNVFIELKPGKTSDNFSKGKDISIIGSKAEVAQRITQGLPQLTVS